MTLPKSHPRHFSHLQRKRIADGVEQGITSVVGLIAQGRGEAFDYLLSEKTHPFAIDAMRAATAMLLAAEHPVISVNGNCAALIPAEIVALGNAFNAPLEVNIFHTSSDRELRIRDHLLAHGATSVLLPEKNCELPGFESNRRFVNPNGIFKADVVFVPLEDGDRAEGLIKCRKKVITVDLNPASRTARRSTVTIVDNLIRVIPVLLSFKDELGDEAETNLSEIISSYDNSQSLRSACKQISDGFQSLAAQDEVRAG